MITNSDKYRCVYTLLIVLVFTSCTKIEMWINPTRDTSLPGPFTLTISKVTHETANLQWTRSTDAGADSVWYEVAINDSVVAYDLESTWYNLSSLIPDTRYSVTVTAVDKRRNQYQVKDEFRTMKPYFNKIINISLNLSWVYYQRAVKTSDNGMLLGGVFVESSAGIGDRGNFLMKLDQNGVIQWFYPISSEDELNKIVECSDGGYLAVFKKSVFRLNGGGTELWNYSNPDNGTQSEITCAAEDANGNFILAGISDKTWGSSISLQYALFSLSSSGAELWYHNGGTTLFNRPNDVAIEEDGAILVFGSAEYTGAVNPYDSGSKVCYWTMHADGNGNFLTQTFYPNAFSGIDYPVSLVTNTDHSFTLSGTSEGIIKPEATYFGRQPRFINLSSDGTISWDKYPYLESHPENDLSVSGVYPMSDNSIFVFAGKHISILNSSGEAVLDKFLQISDSPLTAFLNSHGCYQCFLDGKIFIINPDGFDFVY